MNVINRFEDIIEEFFDLKKYSEEVLTEPISEGKWSIREIVGHLFYWDKFNLESMVPFMVDGVLLPAFPNHDLHNEEAVFYLNRYGNEGEIIDDFAKTRKQLVKVIKELEKGIKFRIENESNKFSPEKFVEIFLDHDFHHLNQIKEKLQNKYQN